ncbi:hypothetical protein LEP1GSC188_2687 [Leptospira weilii serovar Topaz str. LT2116]|uniref:Uncharacterized protein n=1 Tax=Leptospira weilii serovar Topaz str. LT2116 TaxID=1088540 RepID=M3GWH2_9LEPT|nr:hypothetical protein LEP1GSC188_2687 [Leptospira weilii serovar Topaz str. LT2116]
MKASRFRYEIYKPTHRKSVRFKACSKNFNTELSRRFSANKRFKTAKII